MKINEDFVLRTVAGSNIVLPTGKACVDFNGMITLNSTATYIWKCMEKETTVEEIVDKVCQDYEISREDAESAVNTFVKQLKDVGCVE